MDKFGETVRSDDFPNITIHLNYNGQVLLEYIICTARTVCYRVAYNFLGNRHKIFVVGE